MFDYGLEAHREREAELSMFRDAIEAAKLDNRQQAAVKIDEFMLYKHKARLESLIASSQEGNCGMGVANGGSWGSWDPPIQSH